MPHPAGPIRDSGMLFARNAVGYSAYFRCHGTAALESIVPEYFNYFLPHKCCDRDYKAAGAAVWALLEHSVNRGYLALSKVSVEAMLLCIDSCNPNMKRKSGN